MALLGTFIDITRNITQSTSGLSTVSHSLGTNPDVAFPILKSVQTSTSYPAIPAMIPATYGSAPGLITMGALVPSAAGGSIPIISYDAVSILFWQPIR